MLSLDKVERPGQMKKDDMHANVKSQDLYNLNGFWSVATQSVKVRMCVKEQGPDLVLGGL